jgi:DNA-binding transcriptional LysR family regulator
MRKPYELGDLQLRHLLVLQTISEQGSFWAAAERLGCSQAALSQQLATLERILDTRLVERSRGKRKIEMTEAGRLLLRHAQPIVARLQAVRADFTAFGEGKAGTLRVGTFESSGTRILPAVLREFRQKWPQVEVRLTEMAKDDQLLTLLESGELDVCFVIFPLPEGPFEAVQLLQDPYVVVVAHDDPPRIGDRRVTPRLVDLQGVPMVTFGEGRSVAQVEAYVRSRGVDLHVVFRSNYNGTVQGLAAAGGVAALAPLLTMNIQSPETDILGPISELPPRVIGLAWHRDRFRPPSLEAFVHTARGVCEQLEHAADAALRRNRAAGARKYRARPPDPHMVAARRQRSNR